MLTVGKKKGDRLYIISNYKKIEVTEVPWGRELRNDEWEKKLQLVNMMREER